MDGLDENMWSILLYIDEIRIGNPQLDSRFFSLPLHTTFHKIKAKYRVGASGQYNSY